MKKWQCYAGPIALSLAVGTLAGILSMDAMQQYEQGPKPPLAPPGLVFPIVWAILYVLMGIGYGAELCRGGKAGFPFFTQLALNFLWPLLFFVWRLPWAALIDLVLLLALVIWMSIAFGKTVRWAGWLQLPYILWLLFAGYLNLYTAVMLS